MEVSILEHFGRLKDPRIERKKLHELLDIIVLVICGLLSGAEGWDAIEEFGIEKEEWLRKFLPLKNGIPSDDCIAYVISRLPFNEFRDCFMSWSNAMREKVSDKIVNIDGKTVRGLGCCSTPQEIVKKGEIHYIWLVHGRMKTS